MNNKWFISFLFATFLFIYHPQVATAQVLFSDDFNDGNASGWIVPRNTCASPWTVSSNQYGISTNGCITETIPGDLALGLGVNYSFEVDLSMPNTLEDRNFVFKYKDNNNWYGIHTYGNSVYVQKVVGGTEYFLDNWQFSYDFEIENTYHFKIDLINNTTYRVYIDGVLQRIVPDSVPFFDNYSAGLQASGNSQVWFDNVVVTELPAETPTPTPSPSPSPSPFPTASPSATPASTAGLFELPFGYEGRPATSSATFASQFWQKATALFDHSFVSGFFTPFTGTGAVSTSPCGTNLTCYDSHNGTDFDDLGTDGFAYSVSDGVVIYRSETSGVNTCTDDTSGYGCMVLVKYPGNIYGLYGHLQSINVVENQVVTQNTRIGVIGTTGNSSGTHLHFGVLKPVNDKLVSPTTFSMKWKDWEGILKEVSNAKNKFQAYCTYRSPNGVSFAFQDPSGWLGVSKDPWSLPRPKEGCGVHSPYLWKYSIL